MNDHENETGRLSAPIEPALRATGAPAGVTATQLLVGAGAVGWLTISAAGGAVPLTLVDLVVVLGVALVLPLALPGRWWWTVAAAAAVGSLLLAPGGVAALLVVPWLAVGAAATETAIVTAARRRPSAGTAATIERFAPVVLASYSVVAGLAFASSRLGVSLFGIGEPIVELTAVHYSYAGCGALALAIRALAASVGRWRRIALGGVVLTAAAPVVVAGGFVVHGALPQVGGAVAMALGVWCTASVELRLAAGRGRPVPFRVLLAVSGAAIWLPMVLAVAWAAGQHADVPALSIPAMERTHGVANALAFVLGGLLAWWLADCRPVDDRASSPGRAGGQGAGVGSKVSRKASRAALTAPGASFWTQ